MKFREHLFLLLAVAIFGLALYRWINPSAGGNASPIILVIVALLLAARYAARRQALKRAELLKQVPPRPLGLDD